MRHADFRRIDLNLLVAFDALMLEQHVGRGAARIFIGQPAMSHALGRLRESLNDPLFVRSGNRMEPTPLALELSLRVREWLHQASSFLFERGEHDLQNIERRVRIGLVDGFDALLLPSLVRMLQNQAPGVRINSIPAVRDQTLEAIDREELDLAIWVGDVPLKEWHESALLSSTGYDCIHSRHQLALPVKPTLEDLARYQHIAIGWRGENGTVVDRVLAQRGLARDVLVTTSSQLTICSLLATMPLLTLQPHIYSRIYEQIQDLVVTPIECPELTIPVHLVWHRRAAQDPALAFVRRAITTVVQNELEQLSDRVLS
ncbi:MAG: LysR family transcriptional regulator [Alphaproteobacteria bacterium]|nr:MAG: LysR family transcriptional regulator [Alphaproteobacteria bacterium]